MLFPSHAVAARCVAFIHHQAPQLDSQRVRVIDLVPNPRLRKTGDSRRVSPAVSAVVLPQENFPVAKAFWQHSGEGISSRRADYCHKLFSEGSLIDKDSASEEGRTCKGPRRYQRRPSVDKTNNPPGSNGVSEPLDGANNPVEVLDHDRFIEERFGRNLELASAERAKSLIRRQIAGCLSANHHPSAGGASEGQAPSTRPVTGLSEDDIYLYPCGMNAIYSTHRLLLAAKGELKSIEYG